jgi:hypothetical protein
MSKEEPAWKAEVMKTVGTAERGSVVDLLTLLEPHIQAAEQRGRMQGLSEARELALDHARSIESQIGVEGARGVRGVAYLLLKLLRAGPESP